MTALVRAGTGASVGGAPPTLLQQATAYLGGNEPTHWFDFIRNRALIDGEDIGTIADIPSISGTTDLSASGHLVNGADNGLIIPLSGLTYPLSFYVEFVRNTDTGGSEVVARLDDGDVSDHVQFNISTADLVRFAVITATVNQASILPGAATTATVLKAIGRVNTNSVQIALNGSLGTEDVLATLPASPTRLLVGIDSAGVQTFIGHIRRIGLFNNTALPDANLQAASQP